MSAARLAGSLPQGPASGRVPRGAQPELESARLRLRPFREEDLPELVHLAGAREVAAATVRIPHPYTAEAARAFFEAQAEGRARGESEVFAVADKGSGVLLGAIGLEIHPGQGVAEVGFWVGVPYWGRGYATEAGRALVERAFGALGLRRLHAQAYAWNAASCRVLQKLGFRREGCLRQHLLKWGVAQDLEQFGLLASEWGLEGKGP